MVDWLRIDAHEVEWIVRTLYHRLGFRSIVTALSKDGGVDVIAQYFDQSVENNFKYVIQVKRWRGNVGAKLIRELLGVKEDQEAERAVMVSTSDFTRAAKDFANRNKVQLIDRERFEQLLRKVDLLRHDGSLVLPNDPNLEENRRKIILRLLSESRPSGLSSEEIVRAIFTPRFRVTVREDVLREDLSDLSTRGEIIVENGRYFSRISEEEANEVSNSLLIKIKNIDHVISENDIFKLLADKYKIPLPVARRLIPVRDILQTLVLRGDISPVVDGVYMPLNVLISLKRFDWTKDELRDCILELLNIRDVNLDRNMEEVRNLMGLKEGTGDVYYHETPLERMPFTGIILHFCHNGGGGLISAFLYLPLLAQPFAVPTAQSEIAHTDAGTHVIEGAIVDTQVLELIEEEVTRMHKYAADLLGLIRMFEMERKFRVTIGGLGVVFSVDINFKDRKEKRLSDIFDLLLDKAMILTEFLVEVFKKCPPPPMKKIRLMLQEEALGTKERE